MSPCFTKFSIFFFRFDYERTFIYNGYYDEISIDYGEIFIDYEEMNSIASTNNINYTQKSTATTNNINHTQKSTGTTNNINHTQKQQLRPTT